MLKDSTPELVKRTKNLKGGVGGGGGGRVAIEYFLPND